MKFREKKIDGRIEANLIALRCSDAPAGSQKWSLRSLAETLIADGTIDSISHQG